MSEKLEKETVLLNEEDTVEEKSKYTRKISSPIYEPKGKKPKLEELLSTTKRDELLQEIDEDKDMPDELRNFLIAAAERHNAFHFGNIAEYYSHLPAKYKYHFENSGLVIVDYDNAIRNGFISYQKEVDITREKYLEEVITAEKLSENRDEISIKKQKRAEEELEFLNDKEAKKRNNTMSSDISDDEW